MLSTVLQRCVALACLIACVIAGLSNKEMQALAKLSSNNVIALTDKNVDKILGGDRDYELIVLLTTTSLKLDCVLCRDFAPHFPIVARSYARAHPNGVGPDSKNVYFLVADFEKSKKIFGAHKVSNIPKVFHYPSGSINYLQAAQEYTFLAGDHKNLVNDWVRQVTGVSSPIFVPVDYSQVALNAFTTFIVSVTLYLYRSYVGKALCNRGLWSSLAMLVLLLWTGGYMFNQIRGVPYVHETAQGTKYIVPGQTNQLGAETQIVAFFYGFLSILVILLVKRAPTIKNDAVNFFVVSVLSGLIFLVYSGFLNVYAIKVSGYPIKLLTLF